MTNKARGEVSLQVKGETYNLCLTLGALAEIEEGLGIDGIDGLSARFEKPRVADLQTILLALLHGGGHEDFEREDFMAWPLDVKELMKAIKECMAGAGVEEDAPVKKAGNRAQRRAAKKPPKKRPGKSG